jgi:HD-GYP domain-containing protein (c-di-GMP phosphodiesterase class II)
LRSYVDSLTEKRQRDMATIEALAEAVELRDLATGRHQHRVTELARRCVERIDPGLALNEEVAFGFMLHDIGKIGVPDAILRKAGPLDDDEWDVMRRHPEMGVRIVEPIGFAPAATEIILSHHEHWDGSGYPRRLKGEEIPVAARAFAVADAYDAMTTDRPYRGAMAKDDALEVIQTAAGRDFDPEVVEVFIDLPE